MAACLFLTANAFSQLSITSNDLPAATDTMRYSVSNPDPGIDYSITGTNFNWDFSQMTHQEQALKEYVATTNISTIFAILFGFTSFASPMQFDLGGLPYEFPAFYSFHKKTSQLFTLEGFGGILEDLPIPMKYQDVDEVYHLPLTFGKSDSTTFSGVLALGDTLYYERSGSRVTKVDGWGSITTPFDTKPCLRLEITIYSKDSVNYSGLPEPISITTITRQYQWLSPGVKFPMLEVTGFITEAGFAPAMLQYRDYYRPPLPPAPIADFHSNIQECYTKDTLYFTNLTSPLEPMPEFLWEISPSHYEFIEGTSAASFEPILRFLQAGTYDISLTATNAGGSHTLMRQDYINVALNMSIENPASSDALKVFPNPATNSIRIESESTIKQLEIFDLSGRLMMTHSPQSKLQSFTLDISALNPGVYTLRVLSYEDQEPSLVKLIKH